MRGADCWSDHVLLCCRAALQLPRKHRRKPSNLIRKKLNVKKLRDSRTCAVLADTLASALQDTSLDGDELESVWCIFKETVYNTARSILGHPKRKQPDWFDEYNQEI